MNEIMVKTSACALLACVAWPGLVVAGTIQRDGSAIVIGPGSAADSATRIGPGEACVLPLPPTSNGEQAAISNYQAQRRKFMDCVARNPNADQQNLDRSLAAIGNDELESTDIVQQENRGAIDRLGARR